METDIYVRLNYAAYKELETQVQNPEVEKTHRTVEGGYHKSIRLKAGDVVWEFQGPLIKPPREN